MKSAGFPESEVVLVGSTPQQMNLVVRTRGTGTHRPIMFIAHLDVVDALPKDWSFDPFTSFEKDGYFYGRGTLDMKCDVADLGANLTRLGQEKYVPDRDIIVAFTEHEENDEKKRS